MVISGYVLLVLKNWINSYSSPFWKPSLVDENPLRLNFSWFPCSWWRVTCELVLTGMTFDIARPSDVWGRPNIRKRFKRRAAQFSAVGLVFSPRRLLAFYPFLSLLLSHAFPNCESAQIMLQSQVRQKRNVGGLKRVACKHLHNSLCAMLFSLYRTGMEQVYSKEHTFSHLADVRWAFVGMLWAWIVAGWPIARQ